MTVGVFLVFFILEIHFFNKLSFLNYNYKKIIALMYLQLHCDDVFESSP